MVAEGFGGGCGERSRDEVVAGGWGGTLAGLGCVLVGGDDGGKGFVVVAEVDVWSEVATGVLAIAGGITLAVLTAAGGTLAVNSAGGVALDGDGALPAVEKVVGAVVGFTASALTVGVWTLAAPAAAGPPPFTSPTIPCRSALNFAKLCAP